MRLVGQRKRSGLAKRSATEGQTELDPECRLDSRRASRAASPGTSNLPRPKWDHFPWKNQLDRLPVSCDWTPATFAFAGGPSEPPPPRSGFAMRDPPKLKLPLLSIGGRPRVEPCFAASRRSFTAVSWASNLPSMSASGTRATKLVYNKGDLTGGLPASTSLDSPATGLPGWKCARCAQ